MSRFVSLPLLLRITPLLVMAGVSGCDLTKSDKEKVTITFDFSESTLDWMSLFTNYYIGDEEGVEIAADYRALPAPLDTTKKALFITGNNHPDDLNMFFKYRMKGLRANQIYQVGFEVEFATNVPSGVFGVGGSPGEAVTIHADAAMHEPVQIVDYTMEPPYYRLNLVTQTGEDWYTERELGNISNSRDAEEEWIYELKTLNSRQSHTLARTDAYGRLWIIVGTRSGFEGVSSLYYTRVRVLLRRLDG